MPQLIAAAVAAAIPATGAAIGGTTVTWAALIGQVSSIALLTGASVALQYALQPKQHSETRTLLRVPDAPRFVGIGRVQVEGVALMYKAVPTGDVLWIVQAIGNGRIDGIEAILLNDAVVTVQPGGYVATYPFNGGRFAGKASRARVWWKLGAGDQASIVDDPAAEFPGGIFGGDGDQVVQSIRSVWTTLHRLQGIPYVMTAFLRADVIKRQTRHFPQGVPSVKVRHRAALLYDPRDPAQHFDDPATWRYSTNAALARLYKMLTPLSEGGMGIPLSEIDLPSWREAADDCDDAIPLKSGGTEPRYRFCGTYDFSERNVDVLGRMDACCDGQVFFTSAGLIGYRVGKPRTVPPELVFSTRDGSILSYSDISQGSGALAEFNVATLKFTSPDHNFQAIEAPAWREEAWIARDGRERVRPLSLEDVPSFSQARRLGKIYTRKSNPADRGAIRTSLKGLRAWQAPLIAVDIPELELWVEAEVTGLTPADDGSAVDIAWRAVGDAYSWNPAVEEGEPPAAMATDAEDTSIEPPGDLEFVVAAGPRIAAAADPRVTAPGTLILRVRKVGDLTWGADLVGTDNHAETGTLSSGDDYEIAAKWRVDTKDSDWTSPVTITATVDATAIVAATGLLAVRSGTVALIQWTNSAASSAIRNVLYRYRESIGSAQAIYTVWGSRGEAQSYNDAGLVPGTTHYFVRSDTPDGSSADTVPVGVTL